MRKADNGIGYEIQEFSLPRGWRRSTVVPEVFDTWEEAERNMFCRLGNYMGMGKEFRVYESLLY